MAEVFVSAEVTNNCYQLTVNGHQLAVSTLGDIPYLIPGKSYLNSKNHPTMNYWQVSLLLLVFCACTSEQESLEPAILFSPNIISSEAPEFATTVNADGDELFFNRTTPDRSRMQIMRSTLEDGQWSAPLALPFSTGDYLDVDPFLSNDGERLYFSSTRPVDSTQVGGDFDTWYVERIGDGWSDPINPGAPLNSDTTEIFTTVSDSGNAYFVSERGGRRGIVYSPFIDGAYQEAIPIRLQLDGEEVYASNPCIATDESFLIVACRDPKGNGRPDLFVSWKEADGWSPMYNLSPLVNTEYAEFAPGLSKDNSILYFTSERPGMMPPQEEDVRPPGDIYSVALTPILEAIKAAN